MESIHCRLYIEDSTFEFAEGQLKLSTWKLQRKVLTESFSWEFQLETIPQLPTFWPLESCGGFARSALHRWTEETTRDKERRHKKRQQEKRQQEERVLWCSVQDSLSAGLSQWGLHMRSHSNEEAAEVFVFGAFVERLPLCADRCKSRPLASLVLLTGVKRRVPLIKFESNYLIQDSWFRSLNTKLRRCTWSLFDRVKS